MNKIIMTGGTGFIGSWMELKKPDRLNNLLYIVSSYSYITEWELEKCNYIVHLAPVDPSRAIECARRNNARLLYASSGAVYHPEYQNKEYRENKIRWEQMCLDSGVDVVIARLFTFMRSSRAWNMIFKNVRDGYKPVMAKGCIRSFMYPGEMARQMWAILLKGESGQAYDVGSDRAISMESLGLRINKFTGVPFWVSYEDVPMPVYLPKDTAKTRALL